jgi:hypothetical protein
LNLHDLTGLQIETQPGKQTMVTAATSKIADFQHEGGNLNLTGRDYIRLGPALTMYVIEPQSIMLYIKNKFCVYVGGSRLYRTISGRRSHDL